MIRSFSLGLALMLPIAAAPADDPPTRPYVLSQLKQQGLPRLLDGIETPQQWDAKRQEILKVWLDYIGGLPDRPPVNVRVIGRTQREDHLRQQIIYDTVYGDQVTAYLLIPRDESESPAQRPAVLALHPTNAPGKDSVATDQGIKNRMYGLELVRRGYIVLAPDDMTSGQRIFEGREAFRDAPFYEQHPHWSTVAKNLTDHLQAMDVLARQPGVDPQRIGVIGHSFGGYNAYFLSALDTRVRAVVSSCGLCPFSADAAHWAKRDWYTHLPRLSTDIERDRVPFEFNEIIALTAPRPMFFYAAQSDHIFPDWQRVGACLVNVRSLYVWLHAEDHFVSFMGGGEHDFPPAVRAMAYDFLDHWLKSDQQPASDHSGA